MNVGVDEPRREETVLEVDDLPRLAGPEADDPRPGDGNMGRLDLAGEHVNHAGVLQQQVGRSVATRVLKEPFEVHGTILRRWLPGTRVGSQHRIQGGHDRHGQPLRAGPPHDRPLQGLDLDALAGRDDRIDGGSASV